MRQRFLAVLMGLTLMLGTVVVASGILVQPMPQSVQATTSIVERREPPASRSLQRPLIGKLPAADTPRAPRAEHQDPVRVPAAEPPAPTRAVPLGGIDGVEVPLSLGGTFQVHPGQEPAPKGQWTMRVSIEVEEGLPISTEEFADFVMSALNDERSWARAGEVTFARTDSQPDVRIVLASPHTVDAECAPLATNGMWSCGRYGKAMINADRWINNSPAFVQAGGDIETYRTYLINHEVGHLLGKRHEDCATPGGPAPVMTQQSITLMGCTPNGWAYP